MFARLKLWLLSRKLRCADEKRRAAAITALGKLGTAEAARLLVESLRQNSCLALETRSALLLIGKPAVPLLLEACGEATAEDSQKRLHECLACIPDPDALPLWLGSLERGSDIARSVAAIRAIAIKHPSALAEPAVRSVLRRALREPFLPDLIHLLAELGEPCAVPALVNSILRHRPDDRNRWSCEQLIKLLSALLARLPAGSPVEYVKAVLSLPQSIEYPYEEERFGYPGMTADGYEPEVRITGGGPLNLAELHTRARHLLATKQ